MKSIKLV